MHPHGWKGGGGDRGGGRGAAHPHVHDAVEDDVRHGNRAAVCADGGAAAVVGEGARAERALPVPDNHCGRRLGRVASLLASLGTKWKHDGNSSNLKFRNIVSVSSDPPTHTSSFKWPESED